MGAESILQVSVQADLVSSGRVTIDTTVQDKTVAFPMNARLFNRGRERVVRCGRIIPFPEQRNNQGGGANATQTYIQARLCEHLLKPAQIDL